MLNIYENILHIFVCVLTNITKASSGYIPIDNASSWNLRITGIFYLEIFGPLNHPPPPQKFVKLIS